MSGETPAGAAESAASCPAVLRRVAVVRDGRVADRVAAACPPSCEVDRIPGFLGGLAELLTGAADRLVGPTDALSGMREAMAATLREAGLLDRVVLFHPDEQTRREHREAGFLHALAPDASPPTLRRALGLTEESEEPPAGPESAAAGVDPAPAPGSESRDEVSGGEAIGDSDLVEAIHDAGGGGEERLPGLLQRLLGRETGVAGIALALDDAEAEATAPPAHASVRVCFRGECFGRLHAPPPATAASLSPWAGWAARWLALEAQTRQLRELAMRDELTGVWNRRYFNRFLARILERAAADREQVTLMVFDIDDFKVYNDRHGHAAGDAILAGAAQLMQSTVRAHDVVARIGGDEFAVIFWDPRGRREEGSRHPDDVLEIARRFQRGVTDLRFPQLSADAPGTLTISGGIAGFPWDGRTPEELLQKADLMAMESKAQGKNAITLGATGVPPAAGRTP